jgi:hypothetical protein
MHQRLRRALLGLTTTAVLLGGSPVAAEAVDRPTPRADAAADWLSRQLDAGLVVSGYDDGRGNWVRYTDYGLTLDFHLALRDLRVKPRVRRAILAAVEPRTGEYVGTGQIRYAGALGKLLTAVQRERIDPSTYAGGKLVRQLERRVHLAQDTERGRAKDAFDPDGLGGDYSNTIGQSFAVRALAMADSDLADETVRFLLRQQCAQGFFRVYVESVDHTCDGGTEAESGPSADATAFAVQALLVAGRRDVDVRQRRLDNAVAAAEAWLVRKQRRSGAFREDGVANSNTTGLAAAVLADLGRVRRADAAAEWLRKRQVTRALARDGALGGQRGAVAFDRQAFAVAVENGIERGVRYQWRRATAQAAAGLDALRRG